LKLKPKAGNVSNSAVAICDNYSTTDWEKSKEIINVDKKILSMANQNALFHPPTLKNQKRKNKKLNKMPW